MPRRSRQRRSSRRKGRKSSKRRSRKTYRATPSSAVAPNERSRYTVRIEENTLTISPPNTEILERIQGIQDKTTTNVAEVLRNIPNVYRVEELPESSEVKFSIQVSSVQPLGGLYYNKHGYSPQNTTARALFE